LIRPANLPAVVAAGTAPRATKARSYPNWQYALGGSVLLIGAVEVWVGAALQWRLSVPSPAPWITAVCAAVGVVLFAIGVRYALRVTRARPATASGISG
jgi:hypothetical protein